MRDYRWHRVDAFSFPATLPSPPIVSAAAGKLCLRGLLRLVVIVVAALASAVFLSPALPVAADSAPTVNGRFYGDGDYARYTWIDTSYYGSRLYTYYDAPTRKLYVALVVDRSINDNVFTDSQSDGPDYMMSAGWGRGRGQQRGADKLTDSEFAAFSFACEVGSAKDWSWQQGYACQSNGQWVSDSSCGASLGTFPPGLQSASSFAWNINNYAAQAPGPYPWDMYVFGNGISSWKSPFAATNPNTVIGLGGYSAADNPDDLSQGPALTYSSTYEWEWPMVYEWSLDLGPSGADCGSNALYLVTGLSHHSPLKEGTGSAFEKYGESQMAAWCGHAENDCFPEDSDEGGDPIPLADWGDLPDSYGTTSASNGPHYELTVDGPYLGEAVQFEIDGQATADATGDGLEEDGVLRDPGEVWQPDATVSMTVTVGGDDGFLVGWFDWNGDGDFGEVDEQTVFGDLPVGTHVLTLTVPSLANTGTSYLNVRYRLYDGDESLTYNSGGASSSGEVEDYQWSFENEPTAVILSFFGASWQEDVVRVAWRTAIEIDTVGFNVWRSPAVDGEYVKVNGALIPSVSPGSLEGGSYQWIDDVPAGVRYHYKLEELEYDGDRNWYGPVTADESPSEPVPTSVKGVEIEARSRMLLSILVVSGMAVGVSACFSFSGRKGR